MINSCTGANKKNEYPDYVESFFKYGGVVCLMITLLTSMVIFSEKKNWQAYPQRFLGFISFAQISYYQMVFWNQTDVCDDFDLFISLFRNTMGAEGTFTNRMLGLHISDISYYQVKGILMTTKLSISASSLFIELYFNMAINIDVVLTQNN